MPNGIFYSADILRYLRQTHCPFESWFFGLANLACNIKFILIFLSWQKAGEQIPTVMFNLNACVCPYAHNFVLPLDRYLSHVYSLGICQCISSALNIELSICAPALKNIYIQVYSFSGYNDIWVQTMKLVLFWVKKIKEKADDPRASGCLCCRHI